MAMADFRYPTSPPQNLKSAGSGSASQTDMNAIDSDRSIAMEPSASSSSISSSASSLLTASSTTSFQTSPYLPVTPKHTFHSFDPAYSPVVHSDMDACAARDRNPAGPSMTTKTLGVSNLISPPEAEHLDSFDVHSNVLDSKAKNPHPELYSPPITPHVQKIDTVVQGNQDPILFPAASDTATSALQSRPLFSDKEDGHRNVPRDNNLALFELVPAPPHSSEMPALFMVSNVMSHFQADPRSWLKVQREQLKKDDQLRRAAMRSLSRTPAASKPATSSSVRRTFASRVPRARPASQPSHTAYSQREEMALLQPVQSIDHRVAKRTIRTATMPHGNPPTHIAPLLNGTPRPASSGGGQGGKRVPGASPEPRIRTSAPNREDKDFMALEDYCPPLSTLPERTNNLKVDWKGTPLDLSRDPLVHLLHRDEVGLAASLRLDCATYLTSKRRIFIRRLECARTPKEFRKTDAQQACKIDVNKASKLWTAYEKVGWLKLEHIARFI
ncbi:swirm domain containing protein [Sporothrix brasiliensis 5110]|uniref:Swirm domain containing protein n=1 Tax=Sporothrix brasiliensis 5110 TaxID=1398154 RepID=A0A0C2JB22_9PEZI|nr:swirm domain containing protein [Sporothrix brasiliensis 5110]KIH94077.1 swirm domain containing protein [Sporothrix brasiliensis 5110]